MRIMLTVVTPSQESDVVVDCDDATRGADLTGALAANAGQPGAPVSVPAKPIAHDVRDPLRDDISTLGLRDGMRVGVGGVDVRPPIPTSSGLQLHVVGGPDAGAVFALPQGVHELGRSGPLSWRDHSLSRRHARVVASPTSVSVCDLGSSNGTRLDGEPLEAEPAAWEPGQLLEIGDSILELRPARLIDTTVETADPGWLNFMRPPRILPYHVPPVIEVPKAPIERHRRKFPLIAAVIPMLFGVVMALVTGRILFLLFCLMSPVMLLSNFISDRKGDAAAYKREVAEYEEKLAAAQRKLTEAIDAEQKRLREASPDPADAFLTCLLPGRRLWERRRHDRDSLSLRVGTADIPSTITVKGDDDGADHQLHAVPVGLDLPDSRIVGLAGPDEAVDGVLRWLVVQLATYHAPRDLSLSFLTTRGDREWNWLRWLPHLRPADTDSAIAMVGNDAETLTAQVGALAAMVKARKEAAGGDSSITADSFPAHVVVLHGYRQMRGTLGLGQVLDDGPSVGVYAVCTDDSEKSLPERATATVLVDLGNPSYALLRRSGRAPVERVRLDQVSPTWCERIARELAPLKDVGAAEQGETLPDSARLLDVVGLEPPTPDAIRARWTLEPRSTTMAIGVGLDGPFTLDLRSDGPHGLIAGMTGSGKTELLQTIIGSLAVANRPDQMNFVLIDYKGDSAFKDCVNLPHTVGKVNDLDAHLVERALASLQAELKHREHFLAEAGTKDIEDYQSLVAREPHRPPLPRLLLVIDEFAQLVKDLPDFVTGLVSIAQLGRSLGIHLLLATQRPSGVVSAEIRANTNMRIALRVADAADSNDVLQTPDASRIPKSAPGRAYARLGAGALLAFQSGRVGGRRPGAVPDEVPPPFVSPVDWRSVGYQRPQPTRKKVEESADTDLRLLVSTISEAAAAEAIVEQRTPWLEALPERLQWNTLVEGKARLGAVPALPFGRCDLPSQQRQVDAVLDLARDGHMLVIGAPKSGRSQVLRTLAASIARLAHPSDVHVYGLDCGPGALNPLTSLPHCGAVVGRVETERAGRLLAKLAGQIDDRQRLLAQHGYGDITEQRASGVDPLPHLVLMLDRWEGFTTTLGTNDQLHDAVVKILREGASAGVHLVMTGDRSLATNSRISSMTENKLALKLADKSDYSMFGMSPRSMPDSIPPGRCFAPGGLETQVALLAEEDSGQAQAAAITALGQEAGRLVDDETVRPFRVDVLPTMLRLTDALGYVAQPAPSPLALIGVGGDELTASIADLAGSQAFIVAGPGKSGRSSVLLGAARAIVEGGGEVVCIAPRPSPLRELSEQPGVLEVVTDPTLTGAHYEELVTGRPGPVVIVVDDGEGLRDIPAGTFFSGIVKGNVPGVSILLGGHLEGLCGGLSGWQKDAQKVRQGLVLSPQGLGDGDLIGIRIPRNHLGAAVQPGRGYLHQGDGRLRQIATILS